METRLVHPEGRYSVEAGSTRGKDGAAVWDVATFGFVRWTAQAACACTMLAIAVASWAIVAFPVLCTACGHGWAPGLRPTAWLVTLPERRSQRPVCQGCADPERARQAVQRRFLSGVEVRVAGAA